ncbi:MAG: class I SAM-dependent methyltransferase [Bacteriovoracaceae bacterium]|nr:class I SAM-dependent methyltransferase [Bacteriovoracaceae bacterium]
MIGSLFRKFLVDRKIVRGSVHRNDTFGALHKSWGYVYSNHLRGDYAEFGVYLGDSMVSSHDCYSELDNWLNGQLKSPEKWRNELASKYIDHKPTFHGLDTFSGMPNNDEKSDAFSEGNFLTSRELVESKWKENCGLDRNLHLYEGLFTDTAAELHKNLGNKKLVIVHIDCDLSSSTTDALKIVEPYLQLGSIILFDDYNNFCADKNQGERKAFADFRKESKFEFEDWFSYGYCGKAFLTIAENE